MKVFTTLLMVVVINRVPLSKNRNILFTTATDTFTEWLMWSGASVTEKTLERT